MYVVYKYVISRWALSLSLSLSAIQFKMKKKNIDILYKDNKILLKKAHKSIHHCLVSKVGLYNKRKKEIICNDINFKWSWWTNLLFIVIYQNFPLTLIRIFLTLDWLSGPGHTGRIIILIPFSVQTCKQIKAFYHVVFKHSVT